MKSGGASYDVIFPSEYMVGKMIAEDMLAPLDYANIPNMAAIGDEYKGWALTRTTPTACRTCGAPRG